MPQLLINYEAGLSRAYKTAREFVAARMHQLGRYQKDIAADMDLAPSTLSRKCAQSPNDTLKFTLDDFERYIQSTNDTLPIHYLIEKYLANTSQEIEHLEQRLAELKRGAGQGEAEK